MREKVEALKNDRRNQTLHGRASSDLDLENTGRFAKPHAVIGVDAPDYPQLPTSSPWHDDPVGPEEPLGYDINEVAVVGEKFEVEALGDPTKPEEINPSHFPPLGDVGSSPSDASCDDAAFPQGHRANPLDVSASEPALSRGGERPTSPWVSSSPSLLAAVDDPSGGAPAPSADVRAPAAIPTRPKPKPRRA
jgi:hypothetical protein